MTRPTSTVVGHEALSIVLRLLDDLDRHPLAAQFVRTTPRLAELESRARALRERLRVNARRGDLRDVAFCDLCGAYHEAPHGEPARDCP